MNEARLPRISEGALARLPATPEDEAFDARPAHPSVLRAGQWWWTGGGLEPTKQYLLSSLRTRPARARSTRHRMGASDFGDPRQRVTSTRPGREWIPGKIRQVTVGFPEVRTLPMRVILSEMLSATAMDMNQGSPRRAWLVDLSAVLHDLNS